MSTEVVKRKPKRRPRSSSIHLTVWTMNGETLPQETVDALESAIAEVMETSEVRCLSNVVRF